MIYIASDHAGFQLKQDLVAYLKSLSVDVSDLGTHSNISCDYPAFAQQVALSVLSDRGALGLLICGTGIGMSIAANKFRGIRAACVSEEKSASLSRQHNDANILCMGARIISVDQAKRCVDAFLGAKFESQHPRHANRIAQISRFETL